MQYLRQSTASQSVLIGPFVDSTDGVTAETALTIANTDIRLSANGGNMAAKNSGGGTHDEAGWYTITLDATDTATVGRLQLSVSVSGALPVFSEFQVLEEAVYDALFAASAGAPASQASIDNMQSDVDDILSGVTSTGSTLDGLVADIGSNGAGLTALPWNAAWNAEVQSEVTDALNAYDPPTNTEMVAAFTEIKGSTWATTDTLEAIRDRGDAAWTTATGFSTHSAADVWSVATRVLTAATNITAGIADAVWEEAIGDHSATSGSTAESLAAAGGSGDPWITTLPGSYTGTQAGKILADILADTAEIGSAGAGLTEAGGTGDHLTAVPWNAAWDAEVQSECTDALNAYDGPTNTEMTAAFTEIKGSTWSSSTDTLEIIRAAQLDATATGAAVWSYTIGLFQADQILETINNTTLATVADTNELQGDWANGGRLDLILDARASQTSVDDLPTNAELAAAIITGLTTALTEGYRSTGETGSVRDMLYEIIGHLGEFANTGTTKTVKKLDGSTTAKTYTYDDATTPTSITETT